MNGLIILLGADFGVEPCTFNGQQAFALHSHIDTTVAWLDWHVLVDRARRSAALHSLGARRLPDLSAHASDMCVLPIPL